MHLAQFGLHIVAQIIKPKLIIRRIGDITGIGRRFFIIGLLRVNNPRGQAQSPIDFRHPLRIAARQIIVDRNDMHTLPGQSIKIGRESGHQGFTLTSFHLCDIALMQEYAAHQLYIKGAQTQGALSGLAAIGKGLWQQAVQILTRCRARPQLSRLGHETLIIQSLKFRFKRVDFLDQRPGRFDLTIIWCAKNFFGKCS